jgi:hypothetical protein
MLAVKIHQDKDDRNAEFDRTIENISGHIYNKLSPNEVKVLSDNYCIEIISGKGTLPGNNEIVAELVIRKTIVINKDDINIEIDDNVMIISGEKKSESIQKDENKYDRFIIDQSFTFFHWSLMEQLSTGKL